MSCFTAHLVSEACGLKLLLGAQQQQAAGPACEAHVVVALAAAADGDLARMQVGVRGQVGQLQQSVDHLLHLGVGLQQPVGPLEAIRGLQAGDTQTYSSKQSPSHSAV